MNGVYFVRDWREYLVKVGHSNDVRRRLKDFSTGNPSRLELLAVWFGATQADEQALHHVLRQYRVRREWFEMVGTLAFLEKFARETPMVIRRAIVPPSASIPELRFIDCLSFVQASGHDYTVRRWTYDDDVTQLELWQRSR